MLTDLEQKALEKISFERLLQLIPAHTTTRNDLADIPSSNTTNNLITISSNNNSIKRNRNLMTNLTYSESRPTSPPTCPDFKSQISLNSEVAATFSDRRNIPISLSLLRVPVRNPSRVRLRRHTGAQIQWLLRQIINTDDRVKDII